MALFLNIRLNFINSFLTIVSSFYLLNSQLLKLAFKDYQIEWLIIYNQNLWALT